MKDIIPKFPCVPPLTSDEIEIITQSVFLPVTEVSPCELIFVFGCPDVAIVEKAYEAYKSGLGKIILISGGINPNPKIELKDWIYKDIPESKIIKSGLMGRNISEDVIITEEKSVNSIENVVYAKEIFDFTSISSILFISKSMAAGRQYGLLRAHFPHIKKIVPYPYDSTLGDSDRIVTRSNWTLDEQSKSFVFGSYLRLILFSRKGFIEKVKEIENIEKSLLKYTG